jgi:hypothetical protein
MTKSDSKDTFQKLEQQHTLLEDKLQDKDDDKQKLILLDLITNIIKVFILFLKNLFDKMKIE